MERTMYKEPKHFKLADLVVKKTLKLIYLIAFQRRDWRRRISRKTPKEFPRKATLMKTLDVCWQTERKIYCIRKRIKRGRSRAAIYVTTCTVAFLLKGPFFQLTESVVYNLGKIAQIVSVTVFGNKTEPANLREFLLEQQALTAKI